MIGQVMSVVREKFATQVDATLLESVRELVELESDGLVVSWPDGLTALDARRMLEARGK